MSQTLVIIQERTAILRYPTNPVVLQNVKRANQLHRIFGSF